MTFPTRFSVSLRSVVNAFPLTSQPGTRDPPVHRARAHHHHHIARAAHGLEFLDDRVEWVDVLGLHLALPQAVHQIARSDLGFLFLAVTHKVDVRHDHHVRLAEALGKLFEQMPRARCWWGWKTQISRPPRCSGFSKARKRPQGDIHPVG